MRARMKEPADRCLHELFEEQARRTPENLALEDEDISLTYSELDDLADRLAAYLSSKGVGPDEPVGVYMERRAEYVVACLAAMKADGAYLVLELAYPPPLLAEVVADAAPRIVLTQERYADRLPEETEAFSLDEGWEERLEDKPSVDDGQAQGDSQPAHGAGTVLPVACRYQRLCSRRQGRVQRVLHLGDDAAAFARSDDGGYSRRCYVRPQRPDPLSR